MKRRSQIGEVLLINTSYPRNKDQKFSSFGPPLGILQIAAVLKKAGYRTRFLDSQLDNSFKDELTTLLEDSPLFVGMSTYMGGNLQNAIDISSHIKTLSPKTPVVWGGPVASSLPELCLEQNVVDYVVMGAGEETVVSLANSLHANDHDAIENHPNISLKRPGGKVKTGVNCALPQNIEGIPGCDLSLWYDGVKRMGTIPIMTSRGCPRRCAFCYNTFTTKGKYQLRSANSVLNEMRHWHNVFGLSDFSFMDDNFLIDESRSISILEASKANGWRINRIYAHLSDFRSKVTDIIIERRIPVTMCLESGSFRIRKLLNKHINIDKAIILIERLTSAGVPFTTAFMFGIPTETDEDIRKSVELAARIRDISNDNAISMYYLYAPQPSDGIISEISTRDKIAFSLDALANVEVVPVPPNNFIDLRLRPWMKSDSVQFYLELAERWLCNFSRAYRESKPNFAPLAETEAAVRASALFEGIKYPPLSTHSDSPTPSID